MVTWLVFIIFYSLYAEFNEAGRFTKVKRDYRSAKKCRNTKRHKVPALSGPGWNL